MYDYLSGNLWLYVRVVDLYGGATHNLYNSCSTILLQYTEGSAIQVYTIVILLLYYTTTAIRVTTAIHAITQYDTPTNLQTLQVVGGSKLILCC